jgi:hypothetical protein
MTEIPEEIGAFLVFRRREEERWGALLVVDAFGVPHEFLYAGPAQPTPVQELLYGPALEEQLRAQALVMPMLKALRTAPACVVAADSLPSILAVPLALSDGSDLQWLRPPTPLAERFVASLRGGLGLSEPLQRADAALRYVMEYEERQRARTDPARATDPAGE